MTVAVQIRRAISRALLAGTVALTTAGMTSVVSADSRKEWTIYGVIMPTRATARSTRSTRQCQGPEGFLDPFSGQHALARRRLW